MSRQDFIDGLKALGYEPTERDGGRVTMPYTVPIGRFHGQQLTLGLTVPDDFPASCPSGPHISPPLLPVHPNNDLTHPQGGVHDDPDYVGALGGQWQYWSRPFRNWGGSDRSVRSYMRHIQHLFATQ